MKTIKKMFLSTLISGLLIGLALPQLANGEEIKRGSCTLTIESDKHTMSNPANASESWCNVFGAYVEGAGQFTVNGSINYPLNAGTHHYVIGTPSGPYAEANLTIYAIYKEKPAPQPKPQPKPEPKPEPKPQPKPEPKPEPKPQPQPKPEPKPEPKPIVQNPSPKPSEPTKPVKTQPTQPSKNETKQPSTNGNTSQSKASNTTTTAPKTASATKEQIHSSSEKKDVESNNAVETTDEEKDKGPSNESELVKDQEVEEDETSNDIEELASTDEVISTTQDNKVPEKDTGNIVFTILSVLLVAIAGGIGYFWIRKKRKLN